MEEFGVREDTRGVEGASGSVKSPFIEGKNI